MNTHVQIGYSGDDENAPVRVHNRFDGRSGGTVVQAGTITGGLNLSGRGTVSVGGRFTSSGDGYVLVDGLLWLIERGALVSRRNGRVLVDGRPLDPADAIAVPNYTGGAASVVESRGRLVVNGVVIEGYPKR